MSAAGGDSSSQLPAGSLASGTMTASAPLTVLHYLGADDDRGGIVSVVRAMAATGEFACVLGVNPRFEAQRPAPRLATLELP